MTHFDRQNKRPADSLRTVSLTDSRRPTLSRLSATPCIIYGALSYLCTFREGGAFVNGERGRGGRACVLACVNGALRRGEEL